MSRVAYYQTNLQDFLAADEDAILGALSMQHGFALEHQQKHAWQGQIRLLQRLLSMTLRGWIYFEFSIPRMGKRADVVLITGGTVFVIEFKVGSHSFDSYAIEQVHDNALDLKNFHLGSHIAPIVPILIPTAATRQSVPEIKWAADQVAEPLCLSPEGLPQAIEVAVTQCAALPIDPISWSQSGYQPTRTIVEAALALYRQHDVKEITRSEAGADNLGLTAARVDQFIEHAKTVNRKVICFITGVPGAGKTLAGLSIATSRAERHLNEHAVFLSGNGPLVDVLRDLPYRRRTRDQHRRGWSIGMAYRGA